MQTTTSSDRFSNLQLEILKTFNHNLSEQDLIELKKRLSQFFADKLIKIADTVWENNNWDYDKMDELLNVKLRRKI